VHNRNSAERQADVRHEGERLLLSGALTMDTVPGLMGAARAACRGGGVKTLDLAAVDTLDSAGIALALELRRLCGDALRLENLPASALNLARLYSVADQLGIDA
jgi:ABC-type transporter Mla MlaB component